LLLQAGWFQLAALDCAMGAASADGLSAAAGRSGPEMDDHGATHHHSQSTGSSSESTDPGSAPVDADCTFVMACTAAAMVAFLAVPPVSPSADGTRTILPDLDSYTSVYSTHETPPPRLPV
jgi:hypothetical protein